MFLRDYSTRLLNLTAETHNPVVQLSVPVRCPEKILNLKDGVRLFVSSQVDRHYTLIECFSYLAILNARLYAVCEAAAVIAMCLGSFLF